MVNILVVEDDEALRRVICTVLDKHGYTTFPAIDGENALDILDSSHIDLIISDVMMPNMDGWDTLKAIRQNKRFSEIPVIMITALNEEQKEISGLKFGADDYIVKPFILPNLLARIEALLRR